MANLVRREHDLSPVGNPPGAWQDPWRMAEALLRWDPFRELGFTPAALATYTPHFEIKETGDAYVVTADVPGVKEEDLDISLTGDQLSISGKREAERQEENERYHAHERVYGSFTRTFRLPAGVDPERVEASLREGVLTLSLHKREDQRPRKISLVDRIKQAVTGEKSASA